MQDNSLRLEEYDALNLATEEYDNYGVKAIDYDVNGRPILVSGTVQLNRVITYEYDRLGRLIEENDSNQSITRYEYDRFMNRQKMIASGEENYTVEYQYDEANHLLLETKMEGQNVETTRYFYDANGNQCRCEKQSLHGMEEELRQYNGFNQLIKVTKGPVQLQYQYRPDGMRHSKMVYDVQSNIVDKTIHQWAGKNIVMEALNGAVAYSYLYGINLILRQVENSRNYYLYNPQGDVVQMMDENGTNMAQYIYDTFGNINPSSVNNDNPFRYRGEYFDCDTNEYYLRARYYNPATGRFTTQDSVQYFGRKGPNGDTSVDPLSLNLYTYAHNNPQNFKDTSGNIISAILCGAAIGGIVGGVSALITGGDVASGIVSGALSGAVTGGLAAVPGVAAAGKGVQSLVFGIGGAVTGFVGSVIQQSKEKGFGNIDMFELGVDTFLGAVSGIAGGHLAVNLDKWANADVSGKLVRAGVEYVKAAYEEPIKYVVGTSVKKAYQTYNERRAAEQAAARERELQAARIKAAAGAATGAAGTIAGKRSTPQLTNPYIPSNNRPTIKPSPNNPYMNGRTGGWTVPVYNAKNSGKTMPNGPKVSFVNGRKYVM